MPNAGTLQPTHGPARAVNQHPDAGAPDAAEQRACKGSSLPAAERLPVFRNRQQETGEFSLAQRKPQQGLAEGRREQY